MSKVKVQSEYPDLDKYQYSNGIIYYFKKDTSIVHNPYGSAIIHSDGRKYYFIENKCHRLEGPAVIYEDGEEQYWINGKYLNKEEFEVHPERLKFLDKEHLV